MSDYKVKRDYGRLKNYVDGEWVTSRSSRDLAVVDPGSGETIGSVPLSTAAEVDAAVQAAQEAFWDWRTTPPQTRARYMFKLKSVLEENFDELAALVTIDHGKTLDESRGSVRRMIDNVEVAAGIPSLMMGYNLEDGAAAGIDEEVLIQPLGVFAAICPYNFPAMVPFWFIPSALATGNTFVYKPSEQVPLVQNRVMELIDDELDLPPGVLNMVHGDRECVTALMTHPLVQGVSFVGSTPVAEIVYRTCAEHGKRVQCQGGAKNTLVVAADANLKATVPNMIASFFGCAGQRCLAGSILMPIGDAYEPLKAAFVEAASKLRVGYGLDESAQMGPVISKAHQQKVLGYIETAIAEGATLLLDGRNPHVDGYPGGAFVGPTVFDNVTPEMTIAREEIFGPVVAIVRADNLEHAIEMVNSSPYGNAASIYTQDGWTARTFRYRVDAGNIGINLGVAAPMAFFPFGGYKKSFYGDTHGQGRDGINFYTERKVVITRWVKG